MASGYFAGQAQQELARIQSVWSQPISCRSHIHLFPCRWRKMQTPTLVSAMISLLRDSC
jgi:hypothetical protein